MNRRHLGAAASALAVLASGGLVFSASQAAFTATTENDGSAWESGSVDLSDDDADATMYVSTALKPGEDEQRCITVTYGGSNAVDVKLYSYFYSGGLSPFLDLTIEEGTGGGYGDCTGFVPSATAFDGTLADFNSDTFSGFSTGVGDFSPTGPGQSQVYRFTAGLPANVPNYVQGSTSGTTFRWEAQSLP